MSVPVLTLLNNKGGVGKTSLLYHLAWMYVDLGLRVLATDLDPQANLSANCLEEKRLLELWPERGESQTIYGAIEPLVRGVGDVQEVHIEPIHEGLALVPGDQGLSDFEDELSSQWPRCLDGRERAFRVMSAFYRVLQEAARRHRADLVLVDVGPNLGAINRAALIASDHVLVPLGADLFSLRGLQNLGPRLREWHAGWQARVAKVPRAGIPLPSGRMEPIGYVIAQPMVRLDRPVKAYANWTDRIPEVYREAMGLPSPGHGFEQVEDDPYCLAVVRHYSSLAPMGQEARKPMFSLQHTDGAIGAHAKHVRQARDDFERLARDVAERIDLSIP